MAFWIVSSLLWALVCFAPAGGACSSGRDTKGAVSLKETTGLCETTKGVKSYAGYVRLPASTRYAPYEQNIFFWFFEARNNPRQAPLTVWLQGGPGMGSAAQALGGNGPCRVKSDSKTTELNDWSWNTHSNMLYIDQPVQGGFSYDTPTKGRVELFTDQIFPNGVEPEAPPQREIYLGGTFGSQNMANAANTSANAAEAVWDFMQVWLAERKFDSYRRDSISIWTQSYGGHWAPEVAIRFLAKSAELKSSPSTQSGQRQTERPISISHVGILNGVVDFLVQGEHYADFAISNTYNIEAYPQSVADAVTATFEKPGGCKELATACQDLALQLDPENTGANGYVQDKCWNATVMCMFGVYYPYETESGRNPFDIVQDDSTQFPLPYANGFLNRREVQVRLGVDIAGGKGVNYTNYNDAINGVYLTSGDYLRKDFRLQLGSLLDQGVPVTLAYGDRDFRANWYGGEALSKKIPFGGEDGFASAGYADFSVGGSVAGKTRQAGLLSFTRVFQAGHEIPYYKPKATHALFTRALQNKDIPTGFRPASAANPSYSTKGPSSVRDVKQAVAGNTGSTFCYIMNPPLGAGQCSEAQLAALQDGTAVVEDFVVL